MKIMLQYEYKTDRSDNFMQDNFVQVKTHDGEFILFFDESFEKYTDIVVDNKIPVDINMYENKKKVFTSATGIYYAFSLSDSIVLKNYLRLFVQNKLKTKYTHGGIGKFVLVYSVRAVFENRTVVFDRTNEHSIIGIRKYAYVYPKKSDGKVYLHVEFAMHTLFLNAIDATIISDYIQAVQKNLKDKDED